MKICPTASTHGADHDVAVGGEEHAEFRPVEQCRAGCAGAVGGEFAPCVVKPTGDRRDFGEKRRKADARDAPAEPRHESEREDDVEHVGEQLNPERDHRASEADEPAEQRDVGEPRRRGPDTPIIVFGRRRLHGR